MTARSIPSTRTTPAHLVTVTLSGKEVYVDEVFKGSVEPLRTPGFFAVRDTDGFLVKNPDDCMGLWDDETDATGFLARS